VHETKLCLSLLRLAEEALSRADGARILAVRLEVGELSGVVPEALAAAFPVCASGTAAEGAELSIERVAGRDLVLRDLEVL
jgi:hydrogenase nickel incorporation protein HypA/HybF